MPISTAQQRPVDTLGSGPAGGVVGARALLAATDYRNGICADVGGTTYDVALIRDGEIIERSDTLVEKRPILGSVIDIVSVGAGGGSIASLDPLSGSLKVGPESAGAQPGPACFALGGVAPTVTDAQVVLNLLDPDRFLGKRMTLDRSLAERAIRDTLGDGASIVEHAAGIITIAQANMANAIRQMTTQRGLDPREFVMVSFGGGGGLFAAGVCEELGVRTILVPPAAAGFSAWGMLNSDYREDSIVTVSLPLVGENFPQITAHLNRLQAEATAALFKYGFPLEEVQCAYVGEIRFAGQEHTLSTTIDLAATLENSEQALAGLQDQFVQQHRLRYGHGDARAATELVTLRCRAIAPVVRPKFVSPPHIGEISQVASRDVWFASTGWYSDVPIFDRARLGLGVVLKGPAVVEEWTTTIIIPPNWCASVDHIGNLQLTAASEG